MLLRINRLTKKKDIEEVLKKGKGFKEAFLILKTARNKLKISRFGFIVSQKISKKAVIRNKIKRRLREIVKAKLKTIKTGTDNLLIVSPGLETKDFWEIEETIDRLFQSAELI